MKPALGFVSVIGMGYVGLRTSAAFASKGIRTVGIDIDEKRIEQIQQGRAPLHEPQLDSILKKTVRKNLRAIINFSEDLRYNPILPRATEGTNEQQAEKVVELAEKLTGPLDQKRIAVLGLAFKKDTHDIREAASLRVITLLVKKGARVIAYDPLAIPNARKQLGESVELAEDERSALKGADCCIVTTEWSQFGNSRRRTMVLMRTPNLVDARRRYNPKEYESLNFAAVGFGAQQQ